MPHCIIEYSANVEQQTTPQQLIEAVQRGAISSQLFEANAIKLRTASYAHFKTGLTDIGFIHVTARILSGRTLAQRQMLSDEIIKTLQSMSLSELSITVEVIEMEKESYSKVIC